MPVLFNADVSDHDDYFRGRRGTCLVGYRRLMFEMLTEGINILQGGPVLGTWRPSWQRERDDARAWLLGIGGYRAGWIFSSDTICAVLGIDVSVIRRRLRVGEPIIVIPLETGLIGRSGRVRPTAGRAREAA